MLLHYLFDIGSPLVSWMCWRNGCVCRGDIKKIVNDNQPMTQPIWNMCLLSATSAMATSFSPFHLVSLFLAQPFRVPPTHIPALFDFCFYYHNHRDSLSVTFFDFLYASFSSSTPHHSTPFAIEFVLRPLHCSPSALWFPAVSSWDQLTFASVFRMTTNSGSGQPVSASSPKPYSLPTCRLML